MKSGTFKDLLVIYFLNRGVLMHTFIAFSWYYVPRCIASITEGEPRMRRLRIHVCKRFV